MLCWTAVTLRMKGFKDLPLDSLLYFETSFPLVHIQVSTPRLTHVEILFWCFSQTGLFYP